MKQIYYIECNMTHKERLLRIASNIDDRDRSFTMDQISDIKELSEIMVAVIGL